MRQISLAHFRPAVRSFNLGTVPNDDLGRRPSLAGQLSQAMQDTDVSIKELARRLAGGGDPPLKIWEARRRAVQKILNGETRWPNQDRLREIEQALGVETGSLTPGPRRTTDRLEALEASVARADEQRETFLAEAWPALTLLQESQASAIREIQDAVEELRDRVRRLEPGDESHRERVPG